MKKILFYTLLFGLSIMAACNKDDDKTQNPVDLLPPATQTGEDVFACLINGEPFVVRNNYRLTAIYQGGVLQLGFGLDDNKDIVIWLEKEIEIKSYVLNQDVINIGFFKDETLNCNDYQTHDSNPGRINISNINQQQYIISGTFEFKAISLNCNETINITNGRFDMHYIP